MTLPEHVLNAARERLADAIADGEHDGYGHA